MNKYLGFASSAGFVLLGSACGGTDTVRVVPESTETAAVPTFYQDVAPIFTEKCVHCHQKDGIAPFALTDYEAASARSSMIADFTANRLMPPFFIETGGECGSFDESQALSEAQIATIGAWAKGGAVEGTPRELTVPELPKLESGTDFSTPVFTPQIADTELARFDEYRCFQSPVLPERDGFVTGYEVIPGHPKLVHHVLAFIVDPNRVTESGLTNAAVMDQLHASEPDPTREGWSCFGLAGEGVEIESVPVVWAPGEGVVNLPTGLGLSFKQDRRFVIQIHYNMADGAAPEADETKVRLKLADTVEREGVVLFDDKLLDTAFGDEPVQLAAGQQSVKFSFETRGAELGLPEGLPTEMMWLWPHMHGRGHKFTFELDNGSGYSCQGRVNAWNFNWQRIYNYETPLPFDSNSKFRVTCDYNTVGATEPIVPGWGTRNEMCFVMTLLALPPGVTF
jgi:hypothetical protein